MVAAPLEARSYSKYGDVIQADDSRGFVSANMETAKRYDWLAAVQNLRPGKAELNVCLFRSAPSVANPFEIKVLERHAFSTQVFLPMGGAKRYLAVVALGGAAPDLATLAAFIASGSQGLSYKPGVWHHPIVALDAPTDFSCLVWEDKTKDDCEVVALKDRSSREILVDLPR